MKKRKKRKQGKKRGNLFILLKVVLDSLDL